MEQLQLDISELLAKGKGIVNGKCPLYDLEKLLKIFDEWVNIRYELEEGYEAEYCCEDVVIDGVHLSINGSLYYGTFTIEIEYDSRIKSTQNP